MINFQEESAQSYNELYESMLKNILFRGEHNPPTNHPFHMKYALSICPSHLKCKIKHYSIRNERKKVLALLHGLHVFNQKTETHSFGAEFLPSFFFENLGAIETASISKYHQAINYFLNRFDNVRTRDYCFGGKLSSFSTQMAVAGARLTSNYTRVVKITDDQSENNSKIRKSYRGLIRKFNKEGEIYVFTGKNIKNEHFKQAFELHKTVTGHQTRPWESWLEQFNAVKNDKAFLILTQKQDRLIGYSYFLCNSICSFYASAVYSKDNSGAAPASIWQAMEHCKSTGRHAIDIGQQNYHSDAGGDKNEKLNNISFFKRGFGGMDHVYIETYLEK